MPEDSKRERLVGILRSAVEHRDTPFRLSSGGYSNDYLDVRAVVGHGVVLRLAAEVLVEVIGEPFTAIGGETMGADPLAHAVAVLQGVAWFSVRKTPKEHGTGKWIEGAVPGPGAKVVVVEDTVSTGAAILRSLDRVEGLGAEIVCATTMCDRGAAAAPALAARGIRYKPVATFADVGIAPISFA